MIIPNYFTITRWRLPFIHHLTKREDLPQDVTISCITVQKGKLALGRPGPKHRPHHPRKAVQPNIYERSHISTSKVVTQGSLDPKTFAPTTIEEGAKLGVLLLRPTRLLSFTSWTFSFGGVYLECLGPGGRSVEMVLEAILFYALILPYT
jgi:hypothetical protein